MSKKDNIPGMNAELPDVEIKEHVPYTRTFKNDEEATEEYGAVEEMEITDEAVSEQEPQKQPIRAQHIHTHMSEIDDPLALKEDWKDKHHDPNRKYKWLRKDRTLDHKTYSGWRKEPEHPDHFDLVLCSRPMEHEEAQMARNEEKCLYMEGEVADDQMMSAVQQMQVNVPRPILQQIHGGSGPSSRAGEMSVSRNRGRKYYPMYSRGQQ